MRKANTCSSCTVPNGFLHKLIIFTAFSPLILKIACHLTSVVMRLRERCCRLVRSVAAVLATFDYIAFAVFPLPHSVSHEVLHLVQCSKYSFFSVLSLYSCFPAENFSKSYAKLSYSDAINNWLDERIKNACKTCYQENNVRYI